MQTATDNPPARKCPCCGAAAAREESTMPTDTATPYKHYVAQANTRSASNGRAVRFTAETLQEATEKAMRFFKCTRAALSICPILE